MKKKEVNVFPDIVVKLFDNEKYYDNEKFFYLTHQFDFDFIPELLSFNDDIKMLVFNNVGSVIKKEDIDFNEVKRLNDILIQEGVYQNDYRLKNILYNQEKNKYYIIDFEFWDNEFKDFRKCSQKQEIRNFLKI